MIYQILHQRSKFIKHLNAQLKIFRWRQVFDDQSGEVLKAGLESVMFLFEFPDGVSVKLLNECRVRMIPG